MVYPVESSVKPLVKAALVASGNRVPDTVQAGADFPYHGWRVGMNGKALHMPRHADREARAARAGVMRHQIQQRGGDRLRAVLRLLLVTRRVAHFSASSFSLRVRAGWLRTLPRAGSRCD